MEILEYNIGNGARAFSTKRGEGSGNYSGFNITHYCGDTAEHVAECRKMLCRELGIKDNRLILPRQTHDSKPLVVDKEFLALTPQEQKEKLEGIDAIVTDIPQTCIGVSTADCIPVLLYDSRKSAVAAKHAGWRGTVACIAERCIDAMVKHYCSNPADIKAVIAPGISIEAFEIGDEVYDRFAECGFPMENIAARYPTATGGTKWHIDLWEANRLQLLGKGLNVENIHISGICTYSLPSEFFSARRLGIKSGRIFNGIMVL